MSDDADGKPQKKMKYPTKSLNGVYDYDLIVIGGGSGGLAASKEAAKARRGLKVGVFDFVKPSPLGTTWGLGGTCVNVGCIPKKLMHTAGLLGRAIEDLPTYGWAKPEAKHDWSEMVTKVNGYIQQLNFGYSKALKAEGVKYWNAYATFRDKHTVTYEENGKTQEVTSERFLIAVGGRPRAAGIPGGELAMSSDDIFWWQKDPGRTLVVGASYIALECAGFLNELKHDVTVMVRSVLLRGFDQQIAEQIGEMMERSGVRFIQPTIPDRLDREGKEQIRATWTNEGKQVSEVFDTVLYAIGRDPVTADLNLEKAGVVVDRTGKIIVSEAEQTSQSNIYAIGDVIVGPNGEIRPELTPVAIQAGVLLARRLYANSTRLMDYRYVPTTVFTPLEYGCCGLSHEDADRLLGKDNVECYISRFGILESAMNEIDEIPVPRSNCFTGNTLYARRRALAFPQQYAADNDGVEWEDFTPDMEFEIADRSRKFLKQPCCAKLVVDKKNGGRVVGFHYLGPNAGEITQGFALALKKGATKEDFDSLVGIHPTAAEEFTLLTIASSSGNDFMKKGGC